MDETQENQNDLGRTVGLWGRLLGKPYGWVMSLRRWAYHRGILPSQAVDVPVICVGNITCGGTGKTPMVAWVVGQLREMGKTPAILTRGYKAVNGKSDEADLLADLTGVRVEINADRVAGAKAAIAAGADVLVMDDGYQHMRLRRDLNIVLVDTTNPFGGGTCLPVGRLRETPEALADADAVVLTRSNLMPELVDDVRSQVQAYCDAPISTAIHKPVAIVDHYGEHQPLDFLAGKAVLLFCGLGNPEGFLCTAVGLGVGVVGASDLSDHAEYTPEVVFELCSEARRSEADCFLTTQKDAVKLGDCDFEGIEVNKLAVEMEITSGLEELLAKIKAVL